MGRCPPWRGGRGSAASTETKPHEHVLLLPPHQQLGISGPFHPPPTPSLEKAALGGHLSPRQFSVAARESEDPR